MSAAPEVKNCPWPGCGKHATWWFNQDKVSCSDSKCPASTVSVSREDWNRRPAPMVEQGETPDVWRILSRGEKIQDGDEWLDDISPQNTQWRETMRDGARVGDGSQYRRRLRSQPTAATNQGERG